MATALNSYAKDVKSQHGEDGIIAEIFKRIGTKSKWCVELGALNGTHHSNTWQLITNEGWSGVLIEGDPTYYEKLEAHYAGNKRAHTVHTFVDLTPENSLNGILSRTPIPKEFDFLSLDIDGNDYHVWDMLDAYHPRVAVVEFNPTIPNDIAFVQPKDMHVQQGSSLRAITNLAHQKGYKLVAVVFGNAFFVDNESFPKMEMTEPALDEANPDTSYYTRVFQLYDGTLMLDGYQKLFWRGIPITAEAIQVLPASERVYRAGLSANSIRRSIVYWYRRMPFYVLVQKMRSWLA